jgi:hypothetical protein
MEIEMFFAEIGRAINMAMRQRMQAKKGAHADVREECEGDADIADNFVSAPAGLAGSWRYGRCSGSVWERASRGGAEWAEQQGRSSSDRGGKLVWQCGN